MAFSISITFQNFPKPVRTLVIEESIEVQQGLYLCGMEFSKALDTVKHERRIQMLQDINIDGKDLQLIKNMYWQQTAAIKINNNISGYQKIERGVIQGCEPSPEFFSLYSGTILRTIKDRPKHERLIQMTICEVTIKF